MMASGWMVQAFAFWYFLNFWIRGPRIDDTVQTNHVVIRETSRIEVKSVCDTMTEMGTKGTLLIHWTEGSRSEGSLNNEVNLPTNTISQMNLYVSIDLDRGTIANDENTPSTNMVGRRNGRSPCIGRGRFRVFVRINWCSSVVDWVGRRAGGSVPLDTVWGFICMYISGGGWSAF